MTSVRRFMLAGLFIVPVLLVQSVWAGLDFLPESSHYQGRAYKGVSGDRVRVDFAVYDTLGGNEFANAGFAAPGDGQFTYVYQVFNEVEDEDFFVGDPCRWGGLSRGGRFHRDVLVGAASNKTQHDSP